LTRENPGVPASVGALLLPKAAKQRGVIYAASASALQNGLIWVGTDDGLIWVDRNGADQLAERDTARTHPVEQGHSIEASHFDPQVAYASVSRFRIDDLKPYIYRTRDGGNDLAADHERAARSMRRRTRCAKIRRAAACCTPAPRMRSGFPSTTATIGIRCS
jgi:hypothetical protein